MTMFGLKAAEVATLVRAVTHDDLDRDAIETAFARAAWSGIAEPGDGDAGTVVGAIGPADALTALLAKEDVDGLATRTGMERDRLQAALERWWPKVSSSATLLALRQAARFAVRLRIPEQPTWPAQVDDLGPHAPLALWTRGGEDAFAALTESIAIVGARAATGYGEAVTMEFSAGLVDRGFAVVSGAAYGIDGMAHRAALASHGVTVAFLAGGPDRFYPSGHDTLLTRIVEQGVVIAELPCGLPPTKWRFLQRNRLIAAASLATVVVEAGSRSGSLNTAHHAAQLDRPIGAVPGPVTSPASSGCHRLLREGLAMCVTNPDEVVELVRPMVAVEERREAHDPEATRVLDALSRRSSRSVTEVAKRSGLSEREASAVLGRLELEGVSARLLDGWRRS
jgi:DNA processing protein